MEITLHKDDVYSVEIWGGFTGAYVNLNLSAVEAYDLLKALDAKRNEICDMAENYYDCKDCGNTHHKTVTTCPSGGEI